MAIRIGIVGVGKIAQDQHVPTIATDPGFELVATASRQGSVPGIPAFTSIEAMLANGPGLDAVALCQPPQFRFAAAMDAINAGRHVLLEKPPGSTLSEVRTLADCAEAKGVTLFASWHSRFAPAVEAARRWLAERTVTSVEIIWKEDVRHWHPGQAWLWQPGGLGVFDPGINALSIATHILPPFALSSGTLSVPENSTMPIAASLRFTTAGGAPVTAELDFLQTGDQTWDIRIETGSGQLLLAEGGKRLSLDGEPVQTPDTPEYASLYRHFAHLIETRTSDVDLRPQLHVADAFVNCERRAVARFDP